MENSKKIAKKLKIFKKNHYGFISSQNRLEIAEKKRKKKLSFRFVPTRCVIENSKKIKKIKKYHYEFISSQNRLEKAATEKTKNYRSVPFLPDA